MATLDYRTPDEAASIPYAAPSSRWGRLGLNRSTLALLAAILLIAMGQELWSPFMPKYLEAQIETRLRVTGPPWGLSAQAFVVLAVGLFGFWQDFQEAIYYYFGGRIGGKLGTRRSLILFAAIPLAGYAMILAVGNPQAAVIVAFASIPLIGAYDSISQPATLTVIGQTVKSRYRTMAFALQSIQRRIPRIIAYLAGGALVLNLGAIKGVRAGVSISILLVLLAVVIQVKMLRTDTKDTAKHGEGLGLGLLKRFHPELRKLLLADILARWAEGLPRVLFILYAVSASKYTANLNMPGFGILGQTALAFGMLLSIQAFVALLTYIPVGYISSRPGGEKKPFITLTFICFAAFPLAFLVLGRAFGLPGLIAAYAIAGLREIGEPARKAMITELLPADAKTAATGLYWSIRTFSVMLAPLVGAVLWLCIRPEAAFIGAFAAGIAGAAIFAMFFNRRLGVAE